MTQTSQPTKFVIRQYLERRSQEKTPPPSPEQIRQQLGWNLLPASILAAVARIESQVDILLAPAVGAAALMVSAASMKALNLSAGSGLMAVREASARQFVQVLEPGA